MNQTYQEIPQQYSERRRFMRQNMMENGLQNMSLVDVVELMLYYTIPPSQDARPIAQELVDRFGTIDRMTKASSAERKQIPGVNELTDGHFAMIGMFIPYLLRNRMGEYPVFNTLKKLKEFCISLHIKHEYEVLYILCLNSTNRLIKKEVKVTVGTPQHINIELKHIIDAVANTSTVRVVLSHNHPGGLLEASSQDIKFTLVVKSVLESINIALYDHIIVADNEALSMKKLGLI